MIRHLLAPALAAALCAGDAAPAPAPAPIASLALADGPVLQRRWDASLYGRVWSEPGADWLRQRWADSVAEARAATGLDLPALLASATGMRAEFLGMAPGVPARPRLRVQADLGAQAAAVFALLAAKALPGPVAVAGADEARRLAAPAVVLARHGTRLVLAADCDPAPWPAEPVPVDLRLRVDYRAVVEAMHDAMPAPDREALARTLRDLGPWMGTLVWDLGLVPPGAHEELAYDRPATGAIPVDRALLDRFPGDALAVAGLGVDLAEMWRMAGASWLDALDAAMHGGRRQGPEATRRALDAALVGLGVPGGLDQLVREVKGSLAIGVTQGVPFPAVSLAVPRSPAVDALVAAGAAALGGQVPVEGAAAVLPLANVPILITLARDRGHWLLTSDAQFAQPWLSGAPGGFLAAPAGAAMLAGAPADPYLLGGMDTAAVLRTLMPYASMGLAQARRMPNEAKQAASALLGRLARECGPSWIRAAAEGGGSRAVAEGPLGMGVVPVAVLAAVAVPNLLESRVAANEAAAQVTLRAGIFPAQVQFQGGGYMDQDEDHVGEYGSIAELAGRLPAGRVPAGTIRLVTGPLAQGDTANGYRYRAYLPDGAGGAVAAEDAVRPALAAAADQQERFFAVYAWPVAADAGRRMFLLVQDGQVRSVPWDGAEPAWNAGLPDGWGSEPSWPVHQRARR